MPAEAGFASRKPALHVHEKSSSCVTQVALAWQVTVPSPHEAVHVIPLFVVTYPDLQEHSYEPSKLVQSAFTGSQ